MLLSAPTSIPAPPLLPWSYRRTVSHRYYTCSMLSLGPLWTILGKPQSVSQFYFLSVHIEEILYKNVIYIYIILTYPQDYEQSIAASIKKSYPFFWKNSLVISERCCTCWSYTEPLRPKESTHQALLHFNRFSGSSAKSKILKYRLQYKCWTSCILKFPYSEVPKHWFCIINMLKSFYLCMIRYCQHFCQNSCTVS